MKEEKDGLAGLLFLLGPLLLCPVCLIIAAGGAVVVTGAIAFLAENWVVAALLLSVLAVGLVAFRKRRTACCETPPVAENRDTRTGAELPR
jgi:membrane protein implicated in regulation of membrane protease activity